MALFMEYTKVEDTKTVAEIQHLLAANGATSVMVDYNLGKVDGLAFQLKSGELSLPFRLPCRWKSVEALLKKSKKQPPKRDSFENMARRIAWRQLLRWVEAQLALIETGMVKTEEVFMPYAVVGQKTMYEVVEEKKWMQALPAPKPGED